MTLNETGTNGHEYVLGRNSLASARLNLQHYLLVQDVGYHLHPSITLNSGMKVADVATGTGVWILDLAPLHTDMFFHGFDIDLAQVPPAEWLPANTRFDRLDITNPIPAHLVGQFDIVHTRLLMCVIREDPGPILSNLISLLKPGGVIQWVEMDHPTHRFEKARPEYTVSYLKEAAEFPSKLGSEDSRMDPRWVGSLSQYYKKNGLEVLADSHKYRDPYHLPYYCDAAFMVYEEWKSKMRHEDALKYDQILKRAKREVEDARRGISINMEIRTVVGRKSLREF